MKLDWVVNEDTYGFTGLIVVPTGNVAAAPLTYPQFMFQETMQFAGLNRNRAAFPEGEKQFVKAVVGQIGVQPSIWAAGQSILAMLRIVKKPMDTSTAAAITDAQYTMFNSEFANERFAWQHLLHDVFVAGTETRSVINVRANVNQWLEPDEALFLVYENQSSSTLALTFRPYLRTLMKAES